MNTTDTFDYNLCGKLRGKDWFKKMEIYISSKLKRNVVRWYTFLDENLCQHQINLFGFCLFSGEFYFPKSNL